MPSKRKAAGPAAEAREPKVPKELLDKLVKGPMTQGDLETMFRSLKEAVIEPAMTAEMTQHLGYEPGESRPEGQRNHRNGASAKTVITDDGPVRIDVPRDREGSFEPHPRTCVVSVDSSSQLCGAFLDVVALHGFVPPLRQGARL